MAAAGPFEVAYLAVARKADAVILCSLVSLLDKSHIWTFHD